MTTKTDYAKEFLQSGDLRNCLKILKTFRVGISKQDKATLTRAYEMFTNPKYYEQLGFKVDKELLKAKEIATTYLGV